MRYARAALCFILQLGLLALPAGGQEQLWIRQFGANQIDIISRALALDGAGGVFIAGEAWQPQPVNGDIWLARYDGSGNQLWLRQFGTPSMEIAYGLASDSAGGVFIGGMSTASLGGPTPGGLGPYAWLARYDSAGDRMWILQFGTSAEAHALAPDGMGGLFVGGITNVPIGGPVAIGYTWLARYDNAGNQIWIRQFSGGDVAGLASNDGGTVFIGGRRYGGAGGVDAWLAHYDGEGNQVWIRHLGSNASDEAKGLASDGAGGVFVGGTTIGDLGGPSAGGWDAWLARYDAEGNQTWIRQFGSSRSDMARALAEDGRGGVVIAGTTNGDMGGPHGGNGDGWLARFDSSGGQTWILQFGDDNTEQPEAVAVDSIGGIFVGGWILNPFSFNAMLTYFRESCYANCDGSTTEPILNMDDFTCFVRSFTEGKRLSHEEQLTHYTNCDGSTQKPVLNGQDIVCFMNAFAQGCP